MNLCLGNLSSHCRYLPLENFVTLSHLPNGRRVSGVDILKAISDTPHFEFIPRSPIVVSRVSREQNSSTHSFRTLTGVEDNSVCCERSSREFLARVSQRKGLPGKCTVTSSFPSTSVDEHREDGASYPLPVAEEEDEVCLTPLTVPDEENDSNSRPFLANWKAPGYLWRAVAAFCIAGQVIVRVLQGRIHVRNSIQQLESVGPRSLGVCLLTASFVGMVFTIQFVREFARLGLTRSVGGVLALALARELSPVVTAIIVAGRVGSAFAAELGTMQVSEQTDTLRVLRTDPIDYLVTPRVIACCISLPILTVICFTVGMAASVLLADAVYSVSSNVILDSAARALQPWDLISTTIKSVVFGGIISIISCAWGVTTLGGAKGVGESTTSAVVISLVCIFIADFILSWCFFQGAGDALKACMG